MLKMYRGCELVSIQDRESFQIKIFSGGKPITTTTSFADEEIAITEAKRYIDQYRNSRR